MIDAPEPMADCLVPGCEADIVSDQLPFCPRHAEHVSLLWFVQFETELARWLRGDTLLPRSWQRAALEGALGRCAREAIDVGAAVPPGDGA